MKIVVGLGNYGDEYAYTFHNMGFLTVQCLADRLGFKLNKRECSSVTAVGQYNGEKLVLALPLTYMNLSGNAVKELMGKFNAESRDLIVVFDDIDLERGNIRVRPSGSGGTHNGMRHIISRIGTTEFPRVRVGIGRPPENMPLADYVLSNVPKAERETVAAAIEKAADEVEKLLKAQPLFK